MKQDETDNSTIFATKKLIMLNAVDLKWLIFFRSEKSNQNE